MQKKAHDLKIYISESVTRKLKEKHKVAKYELFQCFRNRTGKFAYDVRERHQTNPPTLWFISETNAGRRLKLVFLRYDKTEFVIKSAFEPNAEEERIYRYAQRGQKNEQEET